MKYTAKMKQRMRMQFKQRMKYWNRRLDRNNSIMKWKDDTLILIHPLADEKEVLRRMKLKPIQIANADSYWQHGDSVCLLMLSGNASSEWFSAIRDNGFSKCFTMICYHVKNKKITTKVLHRALKNLSATPEIWEDTFFGKSFQRSI